MVLFSPQFKYYRCLNIILSYYIIHIVTWTTRIVHFYRKYHHIRAYMHMPLHDNIWVNVIMFLILFSAKGDAIMGILFLYLYLYSTSLWSVRRGELVLSYLLTVRTADSSVQKVYHLVEVEHWMYIMGRSSNKFISADYVWSAHVKSHCIILFLV